jgi:hypothetical protein
MSVSDRQPRKGIRRDFVGVVSVIVVAKDAGTVSSAAMFVAAYLNQPVVR